MRTALLYGLFALLAIVTNIGTQDLWIRAWPGPWPIVTSVGAGTIVGLIVKYVLDKRYIFRYQATGALHEGKTFVLYAVMGLVTTVIFWGFESGFQVLFGTSFMRYLGGTIGLVIGYAAKYRLDKHFVFTPPRRVLSRV